MIVNANSIVQYALQIKNGITKHVNENVKIIHMWRRWDIPQNFCLAFTDKLEKQLFIKKAVEVGQ